MMMRLLLLITIAAFFSARAPQGWGAEPNSPHEKITVTENNPSLDDTIDAAEADDAQLEEDNKKWNEFENKFFTLRFGGGILVDTASYIQNAASKQQMSLQ